MIHVEFCSLEFFLRVQNVMCDQQTVGPLPHEELIRVVGRIEAQNGSRTLDASGSQEDLQAARFFSAFSSTSQRGLAYDNPAACKGHSICSGHPTDLIGWKKIERP